jgi:hypothetical protein
MCGLRRQDLPNHAFLEGAAYGKAGFPEFPVVTFLSGYCTSNLNEPKLYRQIYLFRCLIEISSYLSIKSSIENLFKNNL